MLSRHASGIFWLARHVERADFTAKLALASMDASPPGSEFSKDFSMAALRSIGEYRSFCKLRDSGMELGALEYLASRSSNPSSIVSAAQQVETNLESIRSEIPSELFLAAKEFARAAKALEVRSSGNELDGAALIVIHRRSAEAHGAAAGRLLRNGAYEFWQTGRMIERMGNIARSVDLGIGFAKSLRTQDTSACDAFLASYFSNFSALRGVFRRCGGKFGDAAILEFFLLDPDSPSSLAFAILEIERCLGALCKARADASDCLRMASHSAAELRNENAASIAEHGISVFARETIDFGARLSNQIEIDFEFNS